MPGNFTKFLLKEGSVTACSLHSSNNEIPVAIGGIKTFTSNSKNYVFSKEILSILEILSSWRLI